MSTSFLVTGYCPCEKCCGKKADPKDIGKTKSGVYDKANHTLAAPSTYSFGTKIELEGYGTFVVEDRGGNIKNNRLDRFFDTHQEAVEWGSKTINGKSGENVGR